jgi:competence protein ComEA
VVVAAVLLVAIVGAGILLLRSRPSTEPVAKPSVRATLLSTGKPIPSSSGAPVGYRRTSQGTTFLLVHVAGKVRRPGVVRLPVGARVYDALEAAGGARPGVDLATLNLARPLVDGEQVLVGEAQPQARGSPPPQPADGIPTNAPAAPVNLNTATVEQLDSLPGVGPVLAQRIIDARDERGGFTSVQELREVSGIGERRYAELEQRVTIQ